MSTIIVTSAILKTGNGATRFFQVTGTVDGVARKCIIPFFRTRSKTDAAIKTLIAKALSVSTVPASALPVGAVSVANSAAWLGTTTV